MSLNKAIEHGKEHRKPYTGSKAYESVAGIMVTANGAGRIDYILRSRPRKQ